MAWAENIFFDSQGFTLNVPRWEFPEEGITCVLGESGSGKTTLLQALAGLVPCPQMKLSLHGELISELPARSRNFGFVFQDYALFPHLTTWENIAFAAEAKKIPTEMWTESAEKLIDRLGLQRIRSQRASLLSGGEQQRVALARALVTKPRMMLLDEPFSALDEKLRDSARSLISDLSTEFRIPFILVTHDLRDVRSLSRSVLLIERGSVLAAGETKDLLERPPTLVAAAAIAENQILEVEKRGGKIYLSGVELEPKTQIDGGKFCLVAKPWSFQLVPKGQGAVAAEIIKKINEGGHWSAQVRLPNGQNLVARTALDVQPETVMDLKIDSNSLILFKGI